MKKILACTSIRSDYDLLSPLYDLLRHDKDIDLKLLVSGAHLSTSYGYSIKQILDDGHEILISIETLFASDTEVARIKSASLLLQNSIEIVAQFKPDLIIFAGDREDVLVYAMIGGYLGIPTAHFYSGDHVADGYIDNPVRHATSKLSSVHFVTLKEHKRRLMRLGESPDRIHHIGNISLDRFVNHQAISTREIKKRLKVSFKINVYALVIFHPITKELSYAADIFDNILKNLLVHDIPAFISYPNVDPSNHKLINVINNYAQERKFYFYRNLDRNLFLSIYKNAALMIGNSSSGICEAATLQIPAINVGLRQRGRFADNNVIFSNTDFQSISESIDRAFSKDFQDSLKLIKNSYGTGNSALKAYNIIKQNDFNQFVAKTEDPLSVKLS